uniref:Probable 26S proteasome non-ATPase regulatory subunit 3 n=1 Tax=Tanacetum cinerariifolium TaxID=118510 RepID=A0A699JTW9_TANCI|nr:probable 26S proteasome non-ATPase regulatory subunit 3 [Tanacetum cinerariifolium]
MNMTIIGTKWVYKNKLDENRIVTRYKARKFYELNRLLATFVPFGECGKTPNLLNLRTSKKFTVIQVFKIIAVTLFITGLSPYMKHNLFIFHALRIGDLELFKTIAQKFSIAFTSDRTNNLIVILRHNVIRTGLRSISISYTRISLADVAKKLRLDSPNPVADAESIVSKAIRDGAIDATLDHANGWMVSKETGDIYSTNEPQLAFKSRIALCLNMHNEAVRALRFLPNSHKEFYVQIHS